MPDSRAHLYKYLSVMTLREGQKDEDRGSEKRGSLSACIVTRKQRQTKPLGHSSQTACPQCLLVTVALPRYYNVSVRVLGFTMS